MKVRMIIMAIAVVLLLLIALFILGSHKRISPRNETQISRHTQQTKNSGLESSSRYLKENGIDCQHENTNATYNSLAIDPQNPSTLYVGIEGRGVYKSVDRGKSWKRIINGLVVYPDSNDKTQWCFPDLSTIHIDPANPKRLLLIVADITTSYVDWPYGETGGIWQSLDGGERWEQILSGTVNAAGSGSLAVDPQDPKVMYYPVNPDPPTFMEAPIKESLNKKGSVYKTMDGGKTWVELALPMLPGLQAMRIFIDPGDSGHLVFFTQSHDHQYDDKGSVQAELFLHKQHAVLETFDGGKTWKALGDQLPDPYRALFDGDMSSNNFSHLIVRPFLFGTEFPGDTTVQKSFYSVDGGKTFQPTSEYIWVGRYDPHDKEGNRLLGYASLNAKVVLSNDAGKTWQMLTTPPEVMSRKVKISHFVWDPQDAMTVYMSGDLGHVWQSTDHGKNWTKILDLSTLPT